MAEREPRAPRRRTARAWVLALALLALPVLAVAGPALGAEEQGERRSPDELEQRFADRDRSGADLLEAYPPPDVDASAWIVYDGASSEVVAGRDIAEPRPIASLTKLMTALVVVESTRPDDEVVIQEAATKLPPGAATMDLEAGETWRVEQLLQAMLVHSANDAAQALALHVADGSLPGFVQRMQDRGERLELDGTRFTSVTGLDEGALTVSTPLDLSVLAEVALQDTRIRQSVRMREVRLEHPVSGETITFPTRNPLLRGYPGVDGIKTGFTAQAGYLLQAHLTDERGNDLFVLVADAGSEAGRAREARRLLDWAVPLREQVLAVRGGTPVATVAVIDEEDPVGLFACDDVIASARAGQRLDERIELPSALEPPVVAGDEHGTLHVVVQGEDVASTPLCADRDIAARSAWERTVDRASDWQRAWDAGADAVGDALGELAG